MISEHQFSTLYSSVWRTTMPLADGYWAIENLTLERVEPPLPAMAAKSMRAVVNETAFRVFCQLHGGPSTAGRARLAAATTTQLPEAIAYVSRFSNAPPVDPSDVDSDCRKEVAELVNRLLRYFPNRAPTILKPRFSGCGILSECEGDVIEGSCLYEVKAGDRPFRAVDLRQLLTYAALAYAKGALSFTDIGIFNPRTGVVWRRSLEDVSHALSGMRLGDTLSTLVEQFSVASVSR